MTDPRKLAEDVIERGVGAWTTQKEVFLATELLSALDALDAARKEAAEWQRDYELCVAERNKWRTLYGQAFNDADTLKAERDAARKALTLADEGLLAHPEWCGFNRDAPGNGIFYRARRAIRDALAGVSTEGGYNGDDLMGGPEPDFPAEAERDELQAALEELRRRWDELVVAADPSVMENR